MPEIYSSIKLLEEKIKTLLEKLHSLSVPRNVKDLDEKFHELTSIINIPVILLDNLGAITYLNKSAKQFFKTIKILDSYKVLLTNINETEKQFSLEKVFLRFINNQELFEQKFFNISFSEEIGGEKQFDFTIKTFIKRIEYFCLVTISNSEGSKQERKSLITLDQTIPKNINELEDKTKKLFVQTEESKKRKNELEEKKSTKDKFFSIIAHNIRAPFNAILGIAEIIKNEADDLSRDEIINMAKRLYDSSKNVLEMVEDLLDWARLQSNLIDVEKVSFSLEEAIIEILYNFKNNALSKKISISTSIPPDVKVFADMNMISLIIRNLLSNAIKFTNNGGSIKIKVEKENDFVVLSVEDNGVGIKKENLDLILKKDQHYSELGTKQEKGTGLGLILCNEFIKKNNGKILIESEYGVGSKFSITIPLSDQ